jgi:hypothetical protein
MQNDLFPHNRPFGDATETKGSERVGFDLIYDPECSRIPPNLQGARWGKWPTDSQTANGRTD